MESRTSQVYHIYHIFQYLEENNKKRVMQIARGPDAEKRTLMRYRRRCIEKMNWIEGNIEKRGGCEVTEELKQWGKRWREERREMDVMMWYVRGNEIGRKKGCSCDFGGHKLGEPANLKYFVFRCFKTNGQIPHTPMVRKLCNNSTFFTNEQSQTHPLSLSLSLSLSVPFSFWLPRLVLYKQDTFPSLKKKKKIATRQ